MKKSFYQKLLLVLFLGLNLSSFVNAQSIDNERARTIFKLIHSDSISSSKKQFDIAKRILLCAADLIENQHSNLDAANEGIRYLEMLSEISNANISSHKKYISLFLVEEKCESYISAINRSGIKKSYFRNREEKSHYLENLFSFINSDFIIELIERGNAVCKFNIYKNTLRCVTPLGRVFVYKSSLKIRHSRCKKHETIYVSLNKLDFVLDLSKSKSPYKCIKDKFKII